MRGNPRKRGRINHRSSTHLPGDAVAVHANLTGNTPEETSLKGYIRIVTRPTSHPILMLILRTIKQLNIRPRKTAHRYTASRSSLDTKRRSGKESTYETATRNSSRLCNLHRGKEREIYRNRIPNSRVTNVDDSGFNRAIGAATVLCVNGHERSNQLRPDTEHTVFEGELVVIILSSIYLTTL